MRFVRSTRRGAFKTIAFAVTFLAGSATRVAGTPISWEYDLVVGGTLVTLPGDVPVIIPAGTPMTVDVTFDGSGSNCGANPLVADYTIGAPGDDNTADIDFLGFDYAGFGHLEVDSTMSACNPGGFDTGLRLWIDPTDPEHPPIPIGADPTLIDWIDANDGSLFLAIPTSAFLGSAYPSGLPPLLAPCCTEPLLMSREPDNRLGVGIVDIRPIPEPGTATLLGLGALVGAIRRIRRRHATTEPRT